MSNEEIADKYARSCGTDYESLYKAFIEVCELKDSRVEDIDEAMRIFTTNRVEVNEKGKTTDDGTLNIRHCREFKRV